MMDGPLDSDSRMSTLVFRSLVQARAAPLHEENVQSSAAAVWKRFQSSFCLGLEGHGSNVGKP